MACNSETKGKKFFFRRENFFLFFLHWPTVILACSGALQPFWKYLRIASKNGQKSRIYYVKGAKTSPSLTVLIQVSDWAEIWYIASIYIYQGILIVRIDTQTQQKLILACQRIHSQKSKFHHTQQTSPRNLLKQIDQQRRKLFYRSII